jgi:cell wall-associated NlpC family hydrolase
MFTQHPIERRTRVVRSLAIASLLAFSALAVRSTADDNLTIDLPSSQPAASPAPSNASAPPPVVKQSAPSVNRRAASNSGVAMKKFGSRGGQVVNGTKQFTVGRLGVANKAVAIRAARGNNRTLLSKVQPGTYIALNCENGDWYGVLMADRTTGWVRKCDVKMLDYEVVSDHPADSAAYTANNAPNMVSVMANGDQRTVLSAAYAYLGIVPYKWGGTSPNGMDCSAFVQHCFGTVGVRLPRTAREQIAYGMPVTADQLQPADRLYFANSSGEIVHTGIYIGKDNLGRDLFIHSSSRHKGVAVSDLQEDLYRRMYFGARRL